MINKVSIRNFKCLREVSIDLERFTIFVGPNASGKSSILQGMDLLCRLFRGPGGRLTSELSQAVSRGANENLELAAESDGKAYRYRRGSPSPPGTPHLQGQPWSGEGCGVAPDLDSADWKQWTPNQGNQSPLPRSVLLRLEASKLIPPNPASDATVMAPDGSGLHSALANMALNDPDSWQQLQANLHRIIPTIRRLRHTKTQARQLPQTKTENKNQPTALSLKTAFMYQPAALLFDTVGAESLPASQVSEGTLLVLGLLTALHAAVRPSLVLLDDLDRGLHPKAQRELVSLLRGLLKTNPDLQIVAATHSPYMLDCMAANEVRITFLRDDDGASVCAPLASHPQFEKWKNEMTPGEMWSLFGEKWLVEQEVSA